MTYIDKMDTEYTEKIREEELVAQDMIYQEEVQKCRSAKAAKPR